MGSVDRAIRILIAVVITILYFANLISGTTAIILLALAGVFVLTSLMGFCPLYLPFGFSSTKTKK